ncbi:MAG: hypothetical protein OXB88_07375, partial [Bacteriovoracales bacterium]|nr:hypothetical protein [Bacteriovoracales bacterium]
MSFQPLRWPPLQRCQKWWKLVFKKLRAYPKTNFVMKASEIVPGKDESKKCLKACLWHVEGIFCLKTKPGTIAAGCNRR